MLKLHFDTDLGGDIDDLCALAMVLNWPDIELLAVTTVAEHRGKRAGCARYALELAGREDTLVAAGADVSSLTARALAARKCQWYHRHHDRLGDLSRCRTGSASRRRSVGVPRHAGACCRVVREP